MALQHGINKIVTDGLILLLDAANHRSYPGSGTVWYDISGYGKNFTLDNSGIVWSSNGYFNLTDGGIYYDGSTSTSSSSTLVFWIKSTDTQSLFWGGANDSYYVGAYSSSNKEYYGNCGTPDYYQDLVHKSNIYDYFIDGIWHMIEFKNVDLSSWNYSKFNKYNTYIFGNNSSIAMIQIYNKNLSSSESLQNYNIFKYRFGRADELYSSSLYSDANLAQYWRFEGNSNATVGGLNGTDTDITYGSSYGKFGQGAVFNGTSSKIILSSTSLQYQWNDTWTVTAWICFLPGSGMILIAHRSGGYHANYWGLHGWNFIAYPTYLRFLFVTSDAHGTEQRASYSFNSNTWYHVAAAKVGTSYSNWKFYVNGSEISSSNYENAAYGNYGVYGEVYLGFFRWYYNGSYVSPTYSYGYLDDVSIFSRQLTATEVKILAGYTL